MINQETVIITTLLAILTFVIPQRHVLLSLILAVCFIPFDQRIIILNLDFTPARLLVVLTILRIFVRSEQRKIRWNLFDGMIFMWAMCGTAVYLIQWADFKAFVYRSGILFDIIGIYWICRQNIRSWDEVASISKILAMCALVSAILVFVERTTEHNPFVLLGKVTTGVQRGRYRCHGSFQHPITLGLFWANLVPIFIGYAITNRSKISYWWAATAACVLIVIATGSSTPAITLLCVLLFLPLFYLRRYGKQIVLSFIAVILFLSIIMNKPIWHLVSRVRFIPGSTGWHRYLLINAAIEHFDEWALLGTRGTSHWGHGLRDITNNYIRQGVDGGLITLLLFVIVLVMAIRICSKYSLLSAHRTEQWLSWAFCTSVLGHCISCLGVSYFGKIPALLYLTFAVVVMVADKSRQYINSTSRQIVIGKVTFE